MGQLNQRVKLAKDLLKRFDEDPTFLDYIITCDKMWIHHFHAPSKHKNAIWKLKEQSCWKKVQQSKSAGKIMMITFWGQKMIYQHIVLNKKINDKKLLVDSQYYFGC